MASTEIFLKRFKYLQTLGFKYIGGVYCHSDCKEKVMTSVIDTDDDNLWTTLARKINKQLKIEDSE